MVEKDPQVLQEDQENRVLQEPKAEMEFLVLQAQKECRVKRETPDSRGCQEYPEKTELM